MTEPVTDPVLVKKKDKKIVEDEHRTEEQLREFLHVLPPAGFDADFHALHNAYKSLKPDEFEQFIAFFKEAGRNLEAKSPYGETIVELIKQHRHGDEYLAVL
ncbi:MAG: PA4642 family protein [Pseudomonadales bacterium]|jgi:FMN phosphatase YigB (HAD superfamily)|nr:PA4642 family protein [Pseudomonadales bacterium]